MDKKQWSASKFILVITLIFISINTIMVSLELHAITKYEYLSDSINEKHDIDDLLKQLHGSFLFFELESSNAELEISQPTNVEALLSFIEDTQSNLESKNLSEIEKTQLIKVNQLMNSYMEHSIIFRADSDITNDQDSFKIYLITLQTYKREIIESIQFLKNHNQSELRSLIAEQDRYYQTVKQNLMLTLLVPTLILVVLGGISYYYSRKFEKNIYQLAYYDSLTGLYNHETFNKVAEDRLARKEQGKRGLVFIDAHTVTKIDNTFGPVVGDKVLKQISERLQEDFPPPYLLGRLGGCMFMMLTPRFKDNQKIVEVSERIINTINQPFSVDEHTLNVDVNLGISMGSSESSTSLDQLSKQAGNALISSLEKGENTFVQFNEYIEKEISEKLELEEGLKAALTKEEFELYFQPTINVQSNEIGGYEALIRWEKNGQIISPGEFIPLAELNGSIVPIGEWVISTACRQLKVWEGEGLGHLQLSVNVSPIQLKQTTFISNLRAVLKETEINPKSLILEITESVFIEDIEECVVLLNQVKELGVQIALDDFGTGFSSLSYLMQLPIDILKIDKIFVDDLCLTKNYTIVEEIISIAHKLGFLVTAEGVETAEQVRILKEKNVDSLQGYYYGKPKKLD